MNTPRLFRTLEAAALGTAILLPAAFAAETESARSTLTVQAASAGTPISGDLFGVFFEDLNYAADGGLYGELIQNRSFEYSATEQNDWGPFFSWTVERRGGGDGGINIKTARPLHPNNPHYVALSVKTPGQGVGVVNSGFGGIPVQTGNAYEVSFFSHQLFMGEAWSPNNGIEGRPMPVVVRLESATGKVLAEQTFRVTGRDWQRYSARLTPGQSDGAARLVLLAGEKGGIALDEVSLFPVQTFHGRKNGLRADLAQAIADLKPKFVRFPGGCLSHGDGLTNFYRWKDTVGPVEQRKGQRNLWGYHQSVGLGYFEFFQFCEDIGARPLPVLPAGVCCQNADNSPGHGQEGLPLAEMPAYIQDVLDLIEWANGPATTTWGRLRAEAGHPEPFGLKYVGIGNEDQITPVFKERFKLIQEAVKARYPGIQVVGTAGPFPSGEDFDQGWQFAREQKVDVVDEHYYQSPEWFWENLARYDRYDRKGPRVYVGEYAAHERDRRNTLRSALAEAAGFTGFERNGDVVALASYAPLLARRGHTQWTPDMIYFTATDVVLTANYYVQQMVGQNQGDVYLTTDLAKAAGRKLLTASSVRDTRTGDLIVKIVNGDSTPAALSIRLAGLPAGNHRALRTVLANLQADAVNPDGQAPVVRPDTAEMSVAPEFAMEVPANSFTVLRIRR
ncbi:alpha-N-arabinofuranosidase [Opitutaceae bacterium EW11]|nr:alpha-N-arabinofuranosidase [Opitutaceae bacterium EW11]